MGINMEDHKSLEEEALKRKERLKLLKRRREDDEKSNDQEKLPLPKPIFRSYRPLDEKLKDQELPDTEPANVQEEVKEQLESAKVTEVIDELDITNLAPRKPDWDLKRDVAKKLEKLERRTQKAIAELIRERLKSRENDLATIVSAAPTGDA